MGARMRLSSFVIALSQSILMLQVIAANRDVQESWLGRLYIRPEDNYNDETSRHSLALEGSDGMLHLVADLDRVQTIDDFPVILSERPANDLDLDSEPIQIVQDGNMLFAVQNPPTKRWTVTEKRAPTVTEKRFTVTDKRAPTVTDKRFTVTDKRGYDKRFTVTDKRAPTVTDKRFTVTDKRAPTVTDKRFTVTDKRFTVTDKRAPTVTDKRFTVTDKRAPTVTEKRFTVTDKRAPTVTDKRFTVTDKRAPTVTEKRAIKRFLQRLIENADKRMTVTDKRSSYDDDLWDTPADADDYYHTILKRDVNDVSNDEGDKMKPMAMVSKKS